ncbi:DtxR family transcriptional regulator [bacterium]|jgi:DtxR family Mn-dependent transcriptional regulator|nr:DtxR family transcriptional regulator [bacterium]|tara:strand:+ start:2010 stop:2660 length:651 start_codon:yes stop_codon:yes gene_type:complete
MYSVAIEDYLKSIWKLGSKDVGTQELASHLDIKPASVTKMILRLTEMGLVDHTPYKGASLTRRGELEALSVVRRHRLLETFLSQTLGLARDELHVEAERLEHALSKELEAAIAEYLGNPTRDPHGHPIPGPNGELYEETDLPLSDSPINMTLTVMQVPDNDSNILSWLENNNIYPGTKLKIISRDDFDGGINVRIGLSKIRISSSIASLVKISFEE